MTPRLQQDINAAIAYPSPGLADSVAQAPDALTAVESADLQLDDVERDFLAGIPAPIWEAMKPVLVSALNGDLGGVTVDLANGFIHTLSIAQQGSDVAMVLTAPIPDRNVSSD